MRSNIVEVLENTMIQPNIYRMVLPFPYQIPLAGQFVMIQKEGSAHLLPRPLSVSDVYDGKLVLIYQDVGRGTGELATLSVGDKVHYTGPIGHGFPISEIPSQKRLALVGGGVGTAPMVLAARRLLEKGFSVDAHIAFRDQSILKEELASLCAKVMVCTESGREGEKGFVFSTFNPSDYDVVFCCGPTPMMRAVVDACKQSGTEVYVSLENKMACGIGACRVCACATVEGEYKRTCMDGPVFSGLEVDFNA